MAPLFQGFPADISLQYRGFFRLPLLGTDGLRYDRICIKPLQRDRPCHTCSGCQPDRIQRCAWRSRNGDAATDRHILRREKPCSDKASHESSIEGSRSWRSNCNAAYMHFFKTILRSVRYHRRRSTCAVNDCDPHRFTWVHTMQCCIAHNLILYAYRPHSYGNVYCNTSKRTAIYCFADNRFLTFRDKRNVGRFYRCFASYTYLCICVCISAVWKGQFSILAERYWLGDRCNGWYPYSWNSSFAFRKRWAAPGVA